MLVECVVCRYSWALTWLSLPSGDAFQGKHLFWGKLCWCSWEWEALWGSLETYQQEPWWHPPARGLGLSGQGHLALISSRTSSHRLWCWPAAVSGSVALWFAHLLRGLVWTGGEGDRESWAIRSYSTAYRHRCARGCCKDSIFFLNCQHCLWLETIFYLRFKLFTHY